MSHKQDQNGHDQKTNHIVVNEQDAQNEKLIDHRFQRNELSRVQISQNDEDQSNDPIDDSLQQRRLAELEQPTQTQQKPKRGRGNRQGRNTKQYSQQDKNQEKQDKGSSQQDKSSEKQEQNQVKQEQNQEKQQANNQDITFSRGNRGGRGNKKIQVQQNPKVQAENNQELNNSWDVQVKQQKQEDNELQPDEKQNTKLNTSDWSKDINKQKKQEAVTPSRTRGNRNNNRDGENNNREGQNGNRDRNDNQRENHYPQNNESERRPYPGRQNRGQNNRQNRGGFTGGRNYNNNRQVQNSRGSQHRGVYNQRGNRDNTNLDRRNYNNENREGRQGRQGREGGNFDRNRNNQNRNNQNGNFNNRNRDNVGYGATVSVIQPKSQKIVPKSMYCWPQIRFQIRSCTLSLTLRPLSEHQGDILVFPFMDTSFKLYPSTLINLSIKHNYRKRLLQKLSQQHFEKIKIWVKDGSELGRFENVVFLKITDNDASLVIQQLFKFTFMNQKIKSESYILPVCKELGDFKDILNKVIDMAQLITSKHQGLNHIYLTTKDSQFFKQSSKIFLEKIYQEIDENKIFLG